MTEPFLMPFGRHRGAPITELDSGYLAWLHDKIDEWRPPLRAAILAEITRRAAVPAVAVEPVDINTEMIVAAGTRALRQKFAGDVEAQRAIARVAAEVRAALAKPAWLDPEPTEEVPF